jgi:uncharacterized protein HemY
MLSSLNLQPCPPSHTAIVNPSRLICRSRSVSPYSSIQRGEASARKNLIAMATALEHAGDRAGSLAKLEQAAEFAPELPGVWHSLGKAYGGAQRWREAESAMRRAVELGSTTPEVVGDLADVLIYTKRADEAAVLLLSHAMRPEASPMLAWTWAMIELRRARYAEALTHAKAAAGAGFKPGHASLIAAEAARSLGNVKEANEYEKRARELGWTRDKTPIFRE